MKLLRQIGVEILRSKETEMSIAITGLRITQPNFKKIRETVIGKKKLKKIVIKIEKLIFLLLFAFLLLAAYALLLKT